MKNNYLQFGQTIECGSCQKGKYVDCETVHIDCDCICHKSEVNVKKSGKVNIIEVKDQYTDNSLAVTRKELEKIILYGEGILREKNEKS